MFQLCLAATLHLLPGDWQNAHPCVRYVEPMFTVGAYLNSENALSVYASHTWEYDQWFIEGGAVTGYSGATIAPMVRGGYNLSDNAAVFISPAVTGSGDVGLVLGMEFSMGLSQ